MEFNTVNLPFAAALTAAQKLSLLRIEANSTQATMIFSDPEHIGESLELEFHSGQLLVPASSYNSQLRALRRQIEIKLAAARKGGRQ